MKVDYGKGEMEAEVSAYTLVIYEQEFGGRDLIGDFFGKSDKKLSYATVPWTVAVKVLWAALKTHDDRVAPFRSWVKEVGDVDLLEICLALREECNRRFFRTGAAASA